MHVKLINLALLGLGLAACGPDAHGDPDQPEWLIGTFSSVEPGISSINVNSVGHYEFQEDGTLTLTGVNGCRSPTPIEPVTRTWELDGDVVRVALPEEDSLDEWVVSETPDCAVVQVDGVQDGDTETTMMWTRGRVCLRELPPCPQGTSCAGCETVMCDGEPDECG